MVVVTYITWAWAHRGGDQAGSMDYLDHASPGPGPIGGVTLPFLVTSKWAFHCREGEKVGLLLHIEMFHEIPDASSV